MHIFHQFRLLCFKYLIHAQPLLPQVWAEALSFSWGQRLIRLLNFWYILVSHLAGNVGSDRIFVLESFIPHSLWVVEATDDDYARIVDSEATPCQIDLSYVGVWQTRVNAIGQQDFDCSDNPDLFEGRATRGRIACSNVGSRYLSLNLAQAWGICFRRFLWIFSSSDSVEKILVKTKTYIRWWRYFVKTILRCEVLVWTETLAEIHTISCYPVQSLKIYQTFRWTYMKIVGFKIIFRVSWVAFWQGELKFVESLLVVSREGYFVLIIELVRCLYQIHWGARLCRYRSILCSSCSRCPSTCTICSWIILFFQM